MEESNATRTMETELDQKAEQESKEDLRARYFAKQTSLPRHQNKMVAETTSDMFMSGLMCE